MAGQLLRIHNILFDRAGICQLHTHIGIFKFGPQNTGGIQQKQPIIHRHPLLTSGNTGTVFCLGTLSAGNLVDQCGLANIGNSNDHHTQRAVHALCGISLNFLLQYRTDSGLKIGNSLSAFAIRCQCCHSTAAKPGDPPFRCVRIRQIRPIQNNNTGFICTNGIYIRVSAGHRDPGIHDLTNRIHLLQICFDLAAGLGHMTGIPLNIHTFKAHQDIAPILLKSRSASPSSPSGSPGKMQKIALPITSLQSI